MDTYTSLVPGRVLPYLSQEAIDAVSKRNLSLANKLGVSVDEYLYMIDPRYYIAFNS